MSARINLPDLGALFGDPRARAVFDVLLSEPVLGALDAAARRLHQANRAAQLAELAQQAIAEGRHDLQIAAQLYSSDQATAQRMRIEAHELITRAEMLAHLAAQLEHEPDARLDDFLGPILRALVDIGHYAAGIVIGIPAPIPPGPPPPPSPM